METTAAARPETSPIGAVQDEAATTQGGVVDILQLTSSLARNLERLRQAQARAVGLRPPTFNLLGMVAEKGNLGTTVSEAAMRLGVRPQGLSGAVSELVKAGLVERHRDNTDGRARRLRVTKRGMQRLGAEQAIRERLVVEILNQVPQPSVARLVLSRLDTAFRRTLGGA